MKLAKKVFLSMIVVCLFLGFSMERSYAELNTERPPEPTEGTPAKDLLNGYGEIEFNYGPVIQANQYLRLGDCYIRLKSSNTVTVGGSTRAYSTVDTVAVNLYLQRWNGSSWVDVLNIGESKNHNQTSVSGVKDARVAPNYYYRTRAHHWVNHRGILESAQSTSTYIYAN